MNLLTYRDARDAFSAHFAGTISTALRSLLQEKHLYQKLTIPVDDLVNRCSVRLHAEDKKTFAVHAGAYLQSLWFPADPELKGRLHAVSNAVFFQVPHVKMYCTQCERTEPFNSIAATEFFSLSDGKARVLDQGLNVIQVYGLSFMCQSCKRVPEIFIVRRQATKFIICGRAPIEAVQVPEAIPKETRKYFSDAIVAHQSGQTLAGLFLLRVFIEQWARYLGATQTKIDQALDWYATLLPEDFKQRFPSLSKLYADLSDALHAADASDELFVHTLGGLVEHFEARKLFKLSNKPTSPS